MTRARLAVLALFSLLALTGTTAWLAETGASPWVPATVALVKATVIGWVFLELDRSWPGWALLALLLVVAVAGGTALLSMGAA